MKYLRYKTGLWVLIVCAASASPLAYSGPRSVKATYSATVNGMAAGTIVESFEADSANYRISSETKPVGLALLLQRQPLRFSSRGELTSDGLRPALFEARRAPADPPQASAEFDWANGQVQLRYNGRTESVALTPGTQDRLSVMYHFMFSRLDKLRMIDFPMTNGRRLTRYRYRVTPDVDLDTPLGHLKTLHLVKQHEAGDNYAEVWLSPQHQNMAVKIVIVERDGMRFEQVLQHLEIRD